MHIENLRFFYEVATAKSISTVAKSSHISQSALSQQLFKLEDSLNTTLFNRSNKGVTLTDEGEIIYKHCETILNSYEKMLEEVQNASSHITIINIDGLDILLSTLISSSLSIVKNNFTDIVIKEISSEVNANNIIHNIADINISYTNYQDYNGILTKPLFNDNIVFIANKQFKGDTLTLKEFLKTPLILPDDNLHITEILKLNLENLLKEPPELNIALTVNSFEAAAISILHLNGIAPIPLSVYNHLYNNDMYKIIEVEHLNFPFTLFFNVNENLYKKERKFISKLIATIKGFLDN